MIGKRIIAEDAQTVEALKNIHPELIDGLLNNSTEEVTYKFLKEGNIDSDRMDYMARDSLYIGLPDIREIIERINKNCYDREIIVEGKKVNVPIYSYEVLPDIEDFLLKRVKNYEESYNSNSRISLDDLELYFCTRLMESNIQEAQELQMYIRNCMRNDVQDIDLQEFISWNDIRYYNEIMSIIESTENQEMKELAIMCLPNKEGLINLAIEMIDKDNLEDYEKEFISRVKRESKEEGDLSDELRKSIVYLDTRDIEEIELVLEKLKQKGISEEAISSIKIWNNSVNVYNPDEPIFIQGRDGNVYTLDKHPDLSIDLSPRELHSALVYPHKMKREGINGSEIENILEEFEEYNKFYKKKENILENSRMRKFKIGNEPLIGE